MAVSGNCRPLWPAHPSQSPSESSTGNNMPKIHLPQPSPDSGRGAKSGEKFPFRHGVSVLSKSCTLKCCYILLNSATSRACIFFNVVWYYSYFQPRSFPCIGNAKLQQERSAAGIKEKGPCCRSNQGRKDRGRQKVPNCPHGLLLPYLEGGLQKSNAISP